MRIYDYIHQLRKAAPQATFELEPLSVKAARLNPITCHYKIMVTIQPRDKELVFYLSVSKMRLRGIDMYPNLLKQDIHFMKQEINLLTNGVRA